MRSLQHTHPEYRPDIDGLRAVAVSSVIGFHAFPHLVPGGFIGVDVFFVISGFLISTIVFGELERKTFSIFDFYSRRIRRIFPALTAVLLASLVLGWYFLVTDEYKQLGKNLISAALFAQNITLWQESGYFDTSAVLKPTLHLWSLAVEEQFYVFWPLLLMLVWKCRLSFLRTTLTVALLSFTVNVATNEVDAIAAFYLPFSRFWELMIGGLLAYMCLHRPDTLAQFKELQSTLGTLLIASSVAFITSSHSFPGWWALLPTVGTFLIISAGPLTWINKRVLSNTLIVRLGLISYPLYLWHWPLLSFGHIVNPSLSRTHRIGLVIAAIALAEMTFRFIEFPVRQSRSNPRLPVYLTAGLGALPVAGVLIVMGYSSPRLDGVLTVTKNEWDFLKAQPVEIDANATGIYPFHLEREQLTIFLGDSQVAQYAERVSSVQEHTVSNGAVFAIGAGCIPIENVSSDRQQTKGCQKNLSNGLQRAMDPRVTTIVIGGSWNWYFLSKGYYYQDGDKRIGLETDAGYEKACAELADMVRRFTSKNKVVYLLLGNPVNTDFVPHIHVPRFTPWQPWRTNPYVTLDEKQEQLREKILRFASTIDVRVIDPSASICVAGKCRWLTEEGMPVFKDESHFNPDWAIIHADFIDKTLEPFVDTMG